MENPQQAPEPPHTGVRPLSPYGEGYCRFCHFVVGLGPDGLLDQHKRSAFDSRGYAQGEGSSICKGSCRKPPRATPVTSRLAAFRVRPRRDTCPRCNRQRIIVLADGTLAWHTLGAANYTTCPGTGHKL